MKRLWIVTLLLILALFPDVYAAKKTPEKLDYQIEGAGTAAQGFYMVDVSLMAKKRDVSDADLCRAAVHGVLFRGFSNPKARGSQKPLAGSAANEAQHVDFYREFFGPDVTAPDFASVVSGTRAITKVDKRYRVKATVSVNKEALVKYLQELGIVKGLNSAF